MRSGLSHSSVHVPAVLLSAVLWTGLGSSIGCVRDLAVGTRGDESRDAGLPAVDGGNPGVPTDGGPPSSNEDAGPPPCLDSECELIVSSRPLCDEGEQPLCERVSGACTWQCAPAPLKQGPKCGDTHCDVGQRCEPPIGACQDDAQGSVCVDVPLACPQTSAPVCSCDGTTYENACLARLALAWIALEGRCIAPSLVECATKCEEDAPVMIASDTCPGGTPKRQTCAQQGDGSCSWVVEKCATDEACQQPLAPQTPGQCWIDDDCKSPQTCVGASVCPCNAECFAPDTPGTCQ
jgi:hypothetical protein